MSQAQHFKRVRNYDQKINFCDIYLDITQFVKISNMNCTMTLRLYTVKVIMTSTSTFVQVDKN